MKNDYRVGFKFRKNRLLWWLIALLTILLAVAIGMFVFLSLNAKYHFACVLGCEQPDDAALHGQTSATVGTSLYTATTAATLTRFKTSGLEIPKSDIPPTQQPVTRTGKKTTSTVIKIDRDMIIRSRTPIIRSSTPSANTKNSVGRNVNTADAKSRPHSKSTTAPRVTPPADNSVDLRGTTAKPRGQNNSYIIITGKISFQRRLRDDCPEIRV
ncbi:hypothetical protein OS493_023028 [Desmophyllum pertusum]|uniref:Uncharacterized protein n=1 Tax=Desmophyllum pertusum TaxID=174260 RepID=A0A9X0CWF0_9CNID|nr:hypothetical protein OS493_023028 [Desmophyllum pertusum]